VSEADWRKCGSYGGGADRSAQQYCGSRSGTERMRARFKSRRPDYFANSNPAAGCDSDWRRDLNFHGRPGDQVWSVRFPPHGNEELCDLVMTALRTPCQRRCPPLGIRLQRISAAFQVRSTSSAGGLMARSSRLRVRARRGAGRRRMKRVFAVDEIGVHDNHQHTTRVDGEH
jgi:hypothetical protein